MMAGSPLQNGISVVIPVYRSRQSIGLVIEALDAVLPDLTPAYEVVLVEDGSPDDTWSAVAALARQHPHVRALRLMRNFGQHNALLCGVLHARYNVCITMDDDLQHPAAAIPTLLAALDGYDVVYGYPDEEQYNSLLRRLATQVTKLVLQGAMGRDNAQHIAPFRVFRTSLREAFRHFNGSFVNLDVLLTWGTSRFHRLPVHYEKRALGQSNYTFSKLVTHTINLLTGFSTLPLRLGSLLGLLLTAFGLVLLFYVIVVRLIIFGDYQVPGFTFLASVISIFAGSQLFILGIMGEYLARIYFRVMEKPAFVVAEDSAASPPA
jgi:undecaprenyl-phosphate 4-deoxy-4-formamido-L-arabinose transferase